jgi:hypothetical protein
MTSTISRMKVVWYILAGITLMVTLFHYYIALEKDSFALDQFLTNPTKFAGRTATFSARYSNPVDGGFIVIYNHKPVRVHYGLEYAPPHYGEVLIFGRLNEGGFVEALGVHNYNYNYFIYGLSFLAGLVVLWCFLREWKMTRRGFEHA